MQSGKVDPSTLQSARNTEVGERFNRTLFAALDALEERKIDYGLIGGVASSGLGRPRSTHDIDIFVRPEDAGAALEALGLKEFRTEKTDFNWLFKGFKEEILVDVIFKSRGDIYFDNEMNQRTVLTEYHGRKVRMVSPEDLIIIKCAVHDEIGPHHWHDALAILSHANMDWDYLLRRARRAPRRLLALLLYAQSNDIWIPNKLIFELFKTVFGDAAVNSALAGGTYVPTPSASSTSTHASKSTLSVVSPSSPSSGQTSHPASPLVRNEAKKIPEAYVAAKVKDALMQDERTGDQDLKVMVQGNRVLIRGETTTEEHRKLIERVACDVVPDYQIDNQVRVSVLHGPEGVEDVG